MYLSLGSARRGEPHLQSPAGRAGAGRRSAIARTSTWRASATSAATTTKRRRNLARIRGAAAGRARARAPAARVERAHGAWAASTRRRRRSPAGTTNRRWAALCALQPGRRARSAPAHPSAARMLLEIGGQRAGGLRGGARRCAIARTSRSASRRCRNARASRGGGAESRAARRTVHEPRAARSRLGGVRRRAPGSRARPVARAARRDRCSTRPCRSRISPCRTRMRSSHRTARRRQHYRHAVQAYVAEVPAHRRIDRGDPPRRVPRRDPRRRARRGGDVGWFWQLKQVPDAPHTRYLYHLLASHEFQEGLKNYRDLRIMQAQPRALAALARRRSTT